MKGNLDTRIALGVGVFALALVAVLLYCPLFDWLPLHPPESVPSKSVELRPTITWGSVCQGSICKPAALFTGVVVNSMLSIKQELLIKPAIKTLCLRSVGGSSVGSLEMADFISSHGYSTCLPAVGSDSAICASGCTYMFAAGADRKADRNVLFSIHGAAIPAFVKEYADVETGNAGVLQGECSFCQLISRKANGLASGINHAFFILRAPDSNALRIVERNAWTVPGHTLMRVPYEKLQGWGVLDPGVAPLLTWSAGP